MPTNNSHPFESSSRQDFRNSVSPSLFSGIMNKSTMRLIMNQPLANFTAGFINNQSFLD
ncbi:hypothetical protein HMPREF9103_00216 [Lentilactobacillus parafarraginis F0439]|uniref:Uncharacterized protein n=1 Tax=Lentilactobacillus parafarraginis F0439 TaxID=797515 RepID=G9ZKG8_9LACO|nr:hypothetical protein HMPREF9103_00216 [Lentilactobacillus parafarraginis F0439]